jgi:exodeoxyribonuclease VII large subunit
LEQTQNKKFITLSELNNQIKVGLKGLFPKPFWVIAEIVKVFRHGNGQVYIDFVDKDLQNKEQIIKGTLWSNGVRIISGFQNETGIKFDTGINILFLAEVELYHSEVRLTINEIDSSYSIGEKETEKQLIIKRITEEGLLDLNKNLDFPTVPQRIAVISSETAAGYGDFTKHIKNNLYDYSIKYDLFSAIMQGEKSVGTIINRLNEIKIKDKSYDAIVIIRGGGQIMDLSCFDNYDLAKNIAESPIPVLTGIGHERDQSIIDLVAYKNFKNPTDVAQFLISKFSEFDNRIKKSIIEITNQSEKKLNSEINRLNNFSGQIKINTLNIISKKETTLEKYSTNISLLLYEQIRNEGSNIEKLAQSVHDLDPINTLKRGYSITYFNGSIIRDFNKLNVDDIVETHTYNGKLTSKIKNIEAKNY